MSEPSRAAPAPSTLTPLAVLRVAGADAASFLHAQLAGDVAALGDGRWHWNCHLDPQGRVVALLLLLRHDATRLELLLPAAAAAPLRERLQRYVLRSKVQLEVDRACAVCADVAQVGADATGSAASGGELVRDGDRLALELGGAARRRLRLVAVDASAVADAGAETRWRQADVADAIPWIEPLTAGEFTPHALGLTRLAAFSLSKGCYPGQEIVARMHYLGRARRTLARFRGIGPMPPAGARLGGVQHDQALGRVVLCAPLADGAFRGLAVVGDEGTQARVQTAAGTIAVALEAVRD